MSVKMFGPTGAQTWIDLSDNILTVKQLKEKGVMELPWTAGQSVDNVRLTLDGKTLEDSTPLFDCKFLSSSTIHLVLNVHGG